jgi:hypothetical protein
MISLAISILWLAIGVIILGGVIYLALLAVKTFVPVDTRVERAIWLVFFILVLIYVLMALQGGAPFPRLGFGRTGALPTGQQFLSSRQLG